MTHRRLEYAPRYFRRIEDIRERIAADNPAAAARMVERIRAAVERLAASAAIGRPGRVADTRELIISGTPYIVPYRVKGDVVQIITVLHSTSGGRTGSLELLRGAASDRAERMHPATAPPARTSASRAYPAATAPRHNTSAPIPGRGG